MICPYHDLPLCMHIMVIKPLLSLLREILISCNLLVIFSNDSFLGITILFRLKNKVV
jgi:hypothetical protein